MSGIFSELKRRNVIRVGLAYVVASWVLVEALSVVLDIYVAPEWVMRVVVALLGIGLPVALFFAWAFELTPDGVVRDSGQLRPDAIGHQTAKRLDIITIAMVVVGVCLLAADRFLPSGDNTAPGLVQTTPDPTDVAPEPQVARDLKPVIAVLPFKATGSDDGGFLAGGLHDDLLTRLAKLDAFRVISRTSMMEYKGTTKNMRQIGQELGAGYILEGGVQALGSRVRINAQLIDSGADEHLWADVYDRELTAENLFDVQADLAVAIAGELSVTLSINDQALVDEIPTRNIDAYQAWLKGRAIQDTESFTESNARASAAEFAQAVELDPNFALAWAHLSEAWVRAAALSQRQDDREAALAALGRARTLAPGSQEVEIAWANYQYRVLSEYQQALDTMETLAARTTLNASALQLMSWLYRRTGRQAEAYRAMRESNRLEPRSISTAASLITMAFQAGDCKSAAIHARDGFALAPESMDVRAEAADYELYCNGDGRRASDLLRNRPFEANWQKFRAQFAAAAARDYELLLEIAETPYPERSAYSPADRLQDRAVALMLLGSTAEKEAALAEASQLLEAAEPPETAKARHEYARAMMFSASLQGDAQGTRRWITEHRKSLIEWRKQDQYEITGFHLLYARVFAMAGLNDEAIAELGAMLSKPGGHTMRVVAVLPAFDELRDHPDYEALRAQYLDVP